MIRNVFVAKRAAMLIAIYGLLLIPAAESASASAKPHVITFGKWTIVQLSPATAAVTEKPPTAKIRTLLLDGRIKEFVDGSVHDVTDRLFVVRRAFRINDSLPAEAASPPHWQWQRGGWLLVDRLTGHISAVNLPDFDTALSVVSWYRDYAAYWGISDDGKQLYAVVAELNRRKPIVKAAGIKLSKEAEGTGNPECICAIPEWQRAPARVTFDDSSSPKRTYAIRGHAVDLVSDEDDDEEASK
jgi:hypothetical protein